MTEKETDFKARLRSGEQVLVVEITPPKGGDPVPLRFTAKRFHGRVHAIGVSDNRHGICMSSLAAGAVLAAEGMEPIVHVVTRDRNRIALIADCLGAQALGLRNILCTSGTHQTLSICPAARNVFDMDSTQLIEAVAHLGSNGSTFMGERFESAGPFCLGAVAAPFADPVELQLMRLRKKVNAGASFLITQPVHDLDRFRVWWDQITQRSIHEKSAVLAGIQPLLGAASAKTYAESRPSPRVPRSLLDRISAAGSPEAERAAGIDIAVETIREISSLKGLAGFQICADRDEGAVLEIIERSGLGVR
ncbi:MAG: methylenetetrahydrofolate reductase [Desulfobacteraceae bacterium]|nr:MAG: methylenetetrahydrofolate reductase [Desulfobacteraceae bacterium]